MRQQPRFITTAQVANTIGVSEQSVRTWCRHGLIPATRPAGTRKWLIIAEDFEVWMTAGPGPLVRAFVDPTHRSSANEDELLADANEALSPSSRRRAPKPRRAAVSPSRPLAGPPKRTTTDRFWNASRSVALETDRRLRLPYVERRRPWWHGSSNYG